MSGKQLSAGVFVTAIGMTATILLGGGRCGTGEWGCRTLDREGPKCIPLNKFCDGVSHCPDGSDEPPDCTNCNRTYSGKFGVKYPLRVTGPFQRYLPFVCYVHFVAMGGDFGDTVELAFLSFHIGRLESKRESHPACKRGFMKIYETIPRSPDDYGNPPLTFGNFCGRLTERVATYYSTSSNVTLLITVPSRASLTSTSTFSLFLTFRFLPKRSKSNTGQLGSPIPGTFCDRVFLNCHFRPCKIRSPNFPGFYPRNVTCNYHIRQVVIPHAHQASIAVAQDNEYLISIPKGADSSNILSVNVLESSSYLSTDCNGHLTDSLKVFDGATSNSSILAHFCGAGAMPSVLSSGPDMLVQLRSAPYSVLSSARVELSVSVRFELETSASMQRDRRSCVYVIDASRHRRWGVITSPKHTMPENSTCTYRFVGASRHDRVWLYFVSYISLGSRSEDCSLEMYDSDGRWSFIDPIDGFETSTEEFCENSTPKMCVHASDYHPSYSPGRPCRYPEESYLSSGPTFTLRHLFTTPLEARSFVARYEFVDTRQDGVPIGRSDCDRRFDSRSAKGGFISSPRNVFLFGRGGRQNVSCAFHFVGLPSERIRITILRAKLDMTSSATGCATHYDPLAQRHICRTPSGHSMGRGAFLKGVEYWEGYSSDIGCLCNRTSAESKYVFDSTSGNVKLFFIVSMMAPTEDSTHFNFEAKFEFFNWTLCDTHAHLTSLGPEGSLEFQVPRGRTNFTGGEDVSKPLRCRWRIEATTERYIFLHFKGTASPDREGCKDGIMALVYHQSYHWKPATNACVTSDPYARTRSFHTFSSSWYNEVDSLGDFHDSLFLEIVSGSRWQGVRLHFHWLEVAKPFFRGAGGQPIKNAECLFECPEIGACLNSRLWCDGAPHCPSGFDESGCHALAGGITEYLSLVIVLFSILLLAGGLVLAWALVMRHRHRHCGEESPKDCTHRLTPTEDYPMESPIG